MTMDYSAIKKHCFDHPGDIYLVDDKWVCYSDANQGLSEAFDVDGIIEPIISLMNILEVHCVAGCCGLSAYDFTENGIMGLVGPGMAMEYRFYIDDILIEIRGHQCRSVRSDVMNLHISTRMLCELLCHIKRVLESIILKSAQQVDSAEASTIAVPPSDPSGSPR